MSIVARRFSIRQMVFSGGWDLFFKNSPLRWYFWSDAYWELFCCFVNSFCETDRSLFSSIPTLKGNVVVENLSPHDFFPHTHPNSFWLLVSMVPGKKWTGEKKKSKQQLNEWLELVELEDSCLMLGERSQTVAQKNWLLFAFSVSLCWQDLTFPPHVNWVGYKSCSDLQSLYFLLVSCVWQSDGVPNF